jgi:hypothetical protein
VDDAEKKWDKHSLMLHNSRITVTMLHKMESDESQVVTEITNPIALYCIRAKVEGVPLSNISKMGWGNQPRFSSTVSYCTAWPRPPAIMVEVQCYTHDTLLHPGVRPRVVRNVGNHDGITARRYQSSDGLKR